MRRSEGKGLLRDQGEEEEVWEGKVREEGLREEEEHDLTKRRVSQSSLSEPYDRPAGRSGQSMVLSVLVPRAPWSFTDTDARYPSPPPPHR